MALLAWVQLPPSAYRLFLKMEKIDYTGEVKELIKKYKKEDIVFDKTLKYLCERNIADENEFKEEIINCNDIAYTEKQERFQGTRYALFFIYNKKKGRCYVLEFNTQIVVVTIFPLGRRTLRRYKSKRFIK